MDDDKNDFDLIEANAADRRKAQDFDDYNLELSDAEVGRTPRFLGGLNRSRIKEEQKKKDQANLQTMLDLMLMDAEYRQLYNGALDRLRELEDLTEQALVDAQQQLSEADTVLDNILDRAAKMDGTLVFMDANGLVWTQFDQRVKTSDAEAIEWIGNEPSREEFVGARDYSQQIQQHIHSLRKYQTDVLGSARDKLADSDNPLSKEELRDLIDDFDSQLGATAKPVEPAINAPEAHHQNGGLIAEIPKI